MKSTSSKRNMLKDGFIRQDKVNYFTEGFCGYFGGPCWILFTYAVLSNYLNAYLTNVFDLSNWNPVFLSVLPFASLPLIIFGNVIAGRLLDEKKKWGGKARPLLLLSLPLTVLSLLLIFVFPPLASHTSSSGIKVLALILIALGYVVYYAFACPIYLTAHNALVGLSTHNEKERSVLGIMSNLSISAAAGLLNVVLPFCFRFIFAYETDVNVLNSLYGAGNYIYKNGYYVNNSGSILYDTITSYRNWKIFAFILMGFDLAGTFFEYFFTRERVSEEENLTLTRNDVRSKNKTMREEGAICCHDRYWWFLIIFIFLSQFTNAMKNVSQLYYCQAFFPDDNDLYSISTGGTYSGRLSSLGVGISLLSIFFCSLLSNRFGKRKVLMVSSLLSCGIGISGLFLQGNPDITAVLYVMKIFGTSASLYLALSFYTDVLDYEQAISGKRTDGFAMAFYSSIIASSPLLANGTLDTVLSLTGYSNANVTGPGIRNGLAWLFFGIDGVVYLVVFFLMLFSDVGRYHSLVIEELKKQGVTFPSSKEKKSHSPHFSHNERYEEETRRKFFRAQENTARLIEKEKLE